MKKVLAGGSFNLIHQGHIFFLKEAKSLGDYLIIVVASDRTVMKKKPMLFTSKKRKTIVESLKIADKVVVGDDSDYFKIVKEEKPDIIALGYDQKLPRGLSKEIKKEFPECKIVRIKLELKGFSTSNMLKKLGIKNKKGKMIQ